MWAGLHGVGHGEVSREQQLGSLWLWWVSGGGYFAMRFGVKMFRCVVTGLRGFKPIWMILLLVVIIGTWLPTPYSR